MFKSSPDNKILVLLGVLVAGLAFPAYQTLAGERPPVMNDMVSAVLADRAPASVPKVPTLHFENLDLGCQSEPLNIKAHGHFLQMKGQLCRAKNLSIVNKSNGFTASVFELGQGRYQTDMIQLKDGNNELHIRYQNAQGKEKELKIQVSSSHI